ncbi:hypothetical protein L3Y34_011976 [Caenorhabditis briggsae]|uniref:Uncharacterized protein n=2 Tax=Caenorhabditis briggsae TaxID=6238 RepID=A0AAE8ZVW1_CAEBR|nr:hypothetical protein L3Y34_011976 [Caenorhabditis briggsae]
MTTKNTKFVDTVSFERLQQAIKDVKQKETNLQTLKESIDDEDGLIVQYQRSQDLEAKIEEKEVACRKYKVQIERVQKLILAKRRIMYEVKDKIDKKNQDKQKLIDKTEALVAQVETNKDLKEKKKRITHVLTCLVSYRKTFMIQEVMEIFKIDIDGGPASLQPNRKTSDCRCVLVDTIRGLHLPHVASVQLSPHNERETTAAIGLLVHFVNLISRILGYSLRYPVLPYASFSRVYNPVENKLAILSGSRKRSEREKFFEGLGWIGKNIAQLRADCGIPTPVADKTLSVLADWIRAVTEGKYVCIYDRPIDSSSSPASLLINFQPSTEGLAASSD